MCTEAKRIRPDNCEVKRLLCDNSKLLKYTKWKPRYKFEEGLRETIKWIDNNLTGFKSEIYNK